MIECPHAFTGVRGTLQLPDILYQANKSSRIAPIQAVRADRVVGADHIRSAVWHAQRARRQGRQQADRIEVEFMRYLAGERQIQRALAKMGLPKTASEAIVVAIGEGCEDALRHFVDGLGLVEDLTVIRADLQHLRSFGITAKQLEATTPSRRLDLVLEAVALVDR